MYIIGYSTVACVYNKIIMINSYKMSVLITHKYTIVIKCIYIFLTLHFNIVSIKKLYF